MTKTIGDFSRDGLAQIVDTNWDHNGGLRVTVREMIGQAPDKNMVAKMRRLARAALEHPEQTRSAKTLRTWVGDGSYRMTFLVSRLEG